MKKTLFVFLLFVITFSILAIPAGPNIITRTQSDGSSLDIRLRGDEYVNWAETTDGYTIVEENGFYYYADNQGGGDLISSGIRAHNVGMRTATEASFMLNHKTDMRYSPAQVRTKLEQFPRDTNNTRMGGFPTTGTRNLLMILVNYSDTSTQFTQTNFNNYMNQTNFNSTGSFKDYYLENSHNQLTVNTTVSSWVSVTGTHDSYGPDAQWDNLAYEAIQAADVAGVDFSQFDNNGDGVVDGIAIIHQGPGQEATSNTNDVWSHNWELSSAGYSSAQRTFDGVQVNAYTMQPELYGAGSTMTTIGVMCHEFGHNLGAPDYYDTDYATGGSYDGTGQWDIMASGSWNNNGRTPAHHNAYTKWKYYGWTSPTELTAAWSPTLSSVVTSNSDFYYYTTTTANEFFLIENRQQTGFDASIPGHGLVIYHVDENYIATHYSSNSINATTHQGMYPKAAGGTINATSCPFPGTASRTSFTDATSPNSQSWAAASTAKPITNIGEDSGVISLDFMGGSNVSTTVTSPSNGANFFVGDTISITATSTTSSGSVTHTAIDVKDANNMSVYSDNDMTAPYTYSWHALGMTPGVYSITVTGYGSTGHTHSDVVYVYINTAGTILSESFEAGAVPNGWTETIVSGTVNWLFLAGNGTSNPAIASDGVLNAVLRDTDSDDDETRLITPYIDFAEYTDNAVLTFDLAMQVWANDQDELKIYYRTSIGGAWTQIQHFFNDVPNWAVQHVVLPNIGSTYQLAFEGNAKYGYGVCIDDIQVTADLPLPLPAISPSPANSATSVATSSILGWQDDPASSPITGYGLYFDTVNPPVTFTDNGLNNSANPTLAYSTTYYWKVIPYNTTGGDLSCPVWSFTTVAPPSPNAASNPAPGDAATAIDPSILLGWVAPVTGITPDAYKVYLNSTTPPASQIMDADATTFNPSLNHGTTYYWQVVPYTNDLKSVKGNATNCPIWSFTTADVVPTDNTGTGGVVPETEGDIPEGTVITVGDPAVPPSIPDGATALEDIVVTVTSPSPVTLTVTIDFTGLATHVYHVGGAVNLPDVDLSWGAGTVSFDFLFSGAAKGSDTFVVTGEEPILPVELTLFEAAMINNDDVEIHWVTQSETGTAHYNVLRNTEDAVELADNLTINSPVVAEHSSTENEYFFTDSEFNNGETYNYWLEAVDVSGITTYDGPITVTCDFEEDPEDTPDVITTALQNLYPNPFNPNLTVSFSLSNEQNDEQNVVISVYNNRGQHVADVCNELLISGTYTRTWNGLNESGELVNSGVYFFRMQSGNTIQTKKAVLLK